MFAKGVRIVGFGLVAATTATATMLGIGALTTRGLIILLEDAEEKGGR